MPSRPAAPALHVDPRVALAVVLGGALGAVVRRGLLVALPVSGHGWPWATFTANLATGFAMEQMFQSTSESIDALLHETWNHATKVASLSTSLARTRTRLRPDQAMLAGLTHAIGVLPVLAWAENDDRLADDPKLLNTVIAEVHPELGAAILRSWEFPRELLTVPLQYCRYDRANARPDYADVVMVANLCSYIGSDHPLATFDLHTVSALARLGFEPGTASEVLTELLRESGDTLH